MPNLCLLSCSADHVSVHHAALAKEGEHADALSDLLFVVDSATGSKLQELYFGDAVSDNSEAGNKHPQYMKTGQKVSGTV